MKKDTLENINSELFNAFDPQDELCGGIKFTGTANYSLTFGAFGQDTDIEADADMTQDEIEEARFARLSSGQQ